MTVVRLCHVLHSDERGPLGCGRGANLLYLQLEEHASMTAHALPLLLCLLFVLSAAEHVSKHNVLDWVVWLVHSDGAIICDGLFFPVHNCHCFSLAFWRQVILLRVFAVSGVEYCFACVFGHPEAPVMGSYLDRCL